VGLLHVLHLLMELLPQILVFSQRLYGHHLSPEFHLFSLPPLLVSLLIYRLRHLLHLLKALAVRLLVLILALGQQ
jgi:hypothetical protein